MNPIAPTYEYHATIKYVVDGDTVDLSVDLGMRTVVDIRIRLYDWNAPEVSTPGGRALRDYLRLAMTGKAVKVRTYKNPGDKFGRWLAEIELSDGTSFTEHIKGWVAAWLAS